MTTPTYDFGGQVVLITGAARGIGRSHAHAFAKHGADVALLDLGDSPDVDVAYEVGTSAELEAVAEEIEQRGGRALPLAGDVRVEADVKHAVDRTVEEFGTIDVLVNNAATFSGAALTDMDEQMWETVVNTTLKGSWLCSKHVSAHMITQNTNGAIIHTASSSGLQGYPPMLGHYVAAKHGVVGLTKVQSVELADHDITVNAIAPSSVETPGRRQAGQAYELGGDVQEAYDAVETVPAEAVSEAVLWLSSEAARYVTGVTLPVDAGFTAR